MFDEEFGRSLGLWANITCEAVATALPMVLDGNGAPRFEDYYDDGIPKTNYNKYIDSSVESVAVFRGIRTDVTNKWIAVNPLFEKNVSTTLMVQFGTLQSDITMAEHKEIQQLTAQISTATQDIIRRQIVLGARYANTKHQDALNATLTMGSVMYHLAELIGFPVLKEKQIRISRSATNKEIEIKVESSDSIFNFVNRLLTIINVHMSIEVLTAVDVSAIIDVHMSTDVSTTL